VTGDKLKLYFLIGKISGSYRAQETKVVTSASVGVPFAIVFSNERTKTPRRGALPAKHLNGADPFAPLGPVLINRDW
jgi:hypothetical protein